MALFQYYQIVVKYYLKTLLQSLKVATLAADNARLSIILIQSLFPFFTHINNHVQAHEKVAQSFAGLQGIPFLFDQEIQ